MFRSKTFYVLECDKCGNWYNHKEMGSLFMSKDLAMNSADLEGWKYIKGRHYCPDCCHYNEYRDEYVVNN